MTQYIPKSALVAEIERRRSKNARNKLNLAASFEDNYLLSFIDTIEVKEVDLEKEIEEYLSIYWSNEKDLHPFLGHVAKHFFELGMAVSNKAQKDK